MEWRFVVQQQTIGLKLESSKIIADFKKANHFMKALFKYQFTSYTWGTFLEKSGLQVPVVLQRKRQIYDVFEGKMRQI